MAYEKEQRVLAEVTETVAEVKQAAGINSKNAVGASLLIDDPHEFGSDDLSFEEIAAEVMDENEELFALSRCCDRFSPQYLRICKTLEKSVEFLSSVVLTRNALNYSNPMPSLGSLSIARLHQMVSFNFRKVHAALKEKKTKNKEFDLDFYEQMLRFAKILGRLRATDEKAIAIQFGIVRADKYTKATRNLDKSANSAPAPFREFPSYAVNYEALSEAESVDPVITEETPGEQPMLPTPEEKIESGEKLEPSVEISEEQISEDVVISAKESSPETPAEEPLQENPEEKEDFDERFSRLTDKEKEYVVYLVNKPEAFDEYQQRLRDANYCLYYPETIGYIKKALEFVNSS